MKKPFSLLFEMNKDLVDKTVRKQVKRNKGIIYGGQALNKQVSGFLTKDTSDYDIMIKKPAQNAKTTERKLDRTLGGDYFYTKPARHRGTTKLIAVGGDNRRNTEDDFTIADYTRPRNKMPYKTINGERYETLKHIEENRKQILSNPQNKYRWEKDRDVLNRIKAERMLRR